MNNRVTEFSSLPQVYAPSLETIWIDCDSERQCDNLRPLLKAQTIEIMELGIGDESRLREDSIRHALKRKTINIIWGMDWID